MGVELNDLGERIFAHVRVLAQEIGPRPAGSEQEAQARSYVCVQLSSHGYQVEAIPAPFSPLPTFNPFYALAALSLILAGLEIESLPWLAMGMPLVFAGLPQAMRWQMRRRPRPARTESLLACREPGKVQAASLILCAHLDSARALAFRSRLGRRLNGATLTIAQRAAIAVACCALLHWAGFTIPDFLLTVVELGAILAGSWLLFSEIMNQFAHQDRYSPGANDNASGVAVLLALAEHFAAHPPRFLQLQYLFTGAEETGLHGAEAFAAVLNRHPGPTAALCLDMVGAGPDLRYVSQEGTFFPLHTDARLNQAVKTAQPKTRSLRYLQKSGDYAPFLRAGIPATSLQTTGSQDAELAYHSIYDTVEIIDKPALALVAEAVIRSVELLDRRDPSKGEIFSPTS